MNWRYVAIGQLVDGGSSVSYVERLKTLRLCRNKLLVASLSGGPARYCATDALELIDWSGFDAALKEEGLT